MTFLWFPWPLYKILDFSVTSLTCRHPEDIGPGRGAWVDRFKPFVVPTSSNSTHFSTLHCWNIFNTGGGGGGVKVIFLYVEIVKNYVYLYRSLWNKSLSLLSSFFIIPFLGFQGRVIPRLDLCWSKHHEDEIADKEHCGSDVESDHPLILVWL